jgi:hypothetical protein
MIRIVFFLPVRSSSHHSSMRIFICVTEVMALLHGICAAQILIILPYPIRSIPELRKVASYESNSRQIDEKPKSGHIEVP